MLFAVIGVKISSRTVIFPAGPRRQKTKTVQDV
jgi:hypothetical protein